MDIACLLVCWLILWLHDEAGSLEGDDGLRGLVLGVKHDLDRVPKYAEQVGIIQAFHFKSNPCFVVVYHVTIVAIGHGLLKKFWPFGTRLGLLC